VYCEPEVPDFTDLSKPAVLVLEDRDVKVEFPLTGPIDNLIGALDCLFSLDRPVLSWNFKSLLSFIKSRTGILPNSPNKLFDIKVLEGFSGISKVRPSNYREAFERLKALGKANKIYQEVHLPLITRVIPTIETLGVTNQVLKKQVYSCYDIEGQTNGRLKCHKSFKYSFNPHTLSSEDKAALGPASYEREFCLFDYKSHEVCVLQWLSGDKNLGKILDSGQDVFSSIWKYSTGVEPTAVHREKCKSIFLPMVYGQGIKSVAERLNVSVESATRLSNNIKKLFPAAFDFVKNSGNTDYFGRVRQFEDGKEYKSRNFVIQAPAAIICLYKLIKLYDNLPKGCDIVGHIHDGYLLGVDSRERHVKRSIQKILECNEEFHDGLKLFINY